MSDFLAEIVGEFLVEILTGLVGELFGALIPHSGRQSPRGSILGLAEPRHPKG